MPDEHLLNVAEIVEVNNYKANQYLDHDYQLIGMFPTSWEKDRRDPGAVPSTFVAKGMRYILGRPKEVDHYEPKD